jgi:hypothetical protein
MPLVCEKAKINIAEDCSMCALSLLVQRCLRFCSTAILFIERIQIQRERLNAIFLFFVLVPLVETWQDAA